MRVAWFLSALLGLTASNAVAQTAESDFRVITKDLGKFQFNQALPKLEACKQLDLKSSPNAVSGCGLLRAAIFRTQGRISEWADEMIWFRNIGIPAAVPPGDVEKARQVYEGWLDFESLRKLPRSNARIPDGEISVALDQGYENWKPDPTGLALPPSQYFVEFAVSGESGHAIVDTGAPGFIVMTKSTAEKLNITEVIGAAPQMEYPISNYKQQAKNEYRIARTLKIGEIWFENVLVQVDSSDKLPYTIFGTGFLSYFRNVKFLDKHMVLNSYAPPEHCERITYQFVSDSYLLLSRFLIPVFHRGIRYRAMVDTGADAGFGFFNPLATQLLPEGYAKHTARDAAAASSTFQISKQSVVLGKFTIEDTRAELYYETEKQDTNDLLLGSRFRSHADYYFDFENGSFCLSPRIEKMTASQSDALETTKK